MLLGINILIKMLFEEGLTFFYNEEVSGFRSQVSGVRYQHIRAFGFQIITEGNGTIKKACNCNPLWERGIR